MAVREYKNDIFKEGVTRRRYTVSETVSGYSHISEDESQLSQKGSNFTAANAMGDMVLECAAVLSGTVITVSHPSGAPTQFWFIAPANFNTAHTYQFKAGTALPVIFTLQDLKGDKVTDAWKVGAPVNLVRKDSVAFIANGSGARGILPVANGGTGTNSLANVSVGKAAQLSSWRTIITNLSFGKPLVFDGSQDIAPGVTGILPVANGGTGTNSLANATVGKASQLANGRTIVTNLSYPSPVYFNGTANVAPGVTGILPVANGGTGVGSLGNIIAGSAQGLQNTINGVSTNLTWQMHFEQQTLVGTTTADGWLTIGYTKNYRNDFMTAVLTEYQIANANKLITTLNFNQTQWLVAVINPQGGRIPNLTLRVNTIRFRGLDTK